MKDLRWIVRDQENYAGYEIPKFNDSAAGIDLLLQMVVNHLLTDPGSDWINPEKGGGLNGLLRQTASPASIGVYLTHAVDKVEEDIINEQQDMDIADDERLEEIIIDSWEFDQENTELRVNLLIKAVSGDVREIKL